MGNGQDIDGLLSMALSGVDPSSTSKNKYAFAIETLEAALGVSSLFIKSLGAPKNYGNRISEATGANATVVILVGREDVDQEALRRAYRSRAVRPTPALLVVRDGDECIAVEVLTAGENPFPGVEVQALTLDGTPPPAAPSLLAAILSLNGQPWDIARRDLAELQEQGQSELLVKRAPDQKNLQNRIREAAGRCPSVLVVMTTPELRAACGRCLQDVADRVGEAIVVTDGRGRARVEIAEAAARSGDDGGESIDAELDEFVAWNALLLREFFSPAYADEEVTLSVSPPELDEIAPELGGFEGLLKAIRRGPPWSVPDRESLAGVASGLRAQRKYRDRRPPSYAHPSRYLPYGAAADDFPTYLPILAALVALAVEYEHGKGGFYWHVSQRLDLPTWDASELERVNGLWEDLEAWTKTTDGKFGVFRRRTLGGRPNLGKLKAQSIVRAQDIDKLHRLFTKLDLAPARPLPEASTGTLLQRITEESTLSQGVRDAAGKPDYHAPLIERLNQLLLDWDGSSSSEADGRPTAEVHQAYARLGIALFTNAGRPPLTLGWRVPALHDDGRLTLTHDSEVTWETKFDGGPFSIARPVDPSFKGSELLGSKLDLSLRYEDDFRPPTRPRHGLPYSPSALVILGLHSNPQCLVELDSLPGHGKVWLLVSPDNRNFDHWHNVNLIQLKELPALGLPMGWRLFHIRDASTLTMDQRKQLPGMGDGATRPRALRLVGGLRTVRAGRVAFLPHDLPQLEVDAPWDAVIDSPGLKILELGSPETESIQQSPILGDDTTPTRRVYDLEVEQSESRVFALTASTSTGERLGSVRLRLAVGDDRQIDGPVDLTPFCGQNQSTVRGMMVRSPELDPSYTSRFEILPFLLGEQVSKTRPECAEARFLDALAHGSGRMPYGRARSILRRYLDADREFSRSTTSTFEALRQRGMLEIRSDPRGRWTAIGAVPPTLYRLPFDVGGAPVWGVCGTVRLAQWAQLSRSNGQIWSRHLSSKSLPVVRLRGASVALEGFTNAETPPTAIASCSSSLAEIVAALGARGFESKDSRADDYEWFRPASGDWSPSEYHHTFDWSLLRYTDPETRSHKLHSLRSDIAGEVRYRHVRNERWATWIAYDSCVRNLAAKHPKLEGIAPWPLSYDSRKRSLWTPARMRLPLILERSLVACSGSPPGTSRLVRDTDPSHRDPKSLRALSLDEFVGFFDRNYAEFIPENEPRVWLEYQHVPRELVALVANKLGCRITEVGDFR